MFLAYTVKNRMESVCIRSSCVLRQRATFLLQFWRQGKGDYFQGIMFMAELSTPSVCLGKILIQVSRPAGPAGLAHCTCCMPPSSHFESCALHFSLPFFYPMANKHVCSSSSIPSMQLVHIHRLLFSRPALPQSSFRVKVLS